MDEFDLIETYFKPLSQGYGGSLGLKDDGAIIAVPPGQELVITKDAISAGVHFIGDESPPLIAKKLLRVNLSDLAAMGAQPLAYFLALMLPKDMKAEWVKNFAQGLEEDQREFGIHLAGGDTISTYGPLSFSITALGTILAGKALRRSGARPGDGIYVSGTLGDSTLGLLSLQQGKGESFLEQRYLVPQPRIVLGRKLQGIAHATMDISDGLMQDLSHICRASGVGAVIHRAHIPLSPQAAALISKESALWSAPLCGGDDYELLFTAAEEQASQLNAVAIALNLSLTRIGTINKSANIQLLDESGNECELAYKGFKHF